jgi:hypothetical protein
MPHWVRSQRGGTPSTPVQARGRFCEKLSHGAMRYRVAGEFTMEAAKLPPIVDRVMGGQLERRGAFKHRYTDQIGGSLRILRFWGPGWPI